jgi:formamidopyrimidine-DNA glycosylase
MPELPDVTVYVEHIARRVVGHALKSVRLASPFVLRTVQPPLRESFGACVRGVSRLGKRIVLRLDSEIFVVVHLMIAGRFAWKDPPAPLIPKKVGLAAFDFDVGTLLLTEASTKKRASIHLVRGEPALRALDPGGLEVMTADVASFREALFRENHTLKRSLTDPRLFSGIGNAYSDEILHRAKMSPARLTQKLSDAEVSRLYEATVATLDEWTERLRKESGDAFPTKVTAFREEMAVHGKYGKACPVCGAKVLRIVYAENEANYCATCQTGGKLLADRALSRLLGKDWPKTLEDLEAMKKDRAEPH